MHDMGARAGPKAQKCTLASYSTRKTRLVVVLYNATMSHVTA